MYHCHCSLCRKQSGTAANSATLVNETLFEWVCGTDSIGTFKKIQALLLAFVRAVDLQFLTKLEIAHLYGFHLDY